MFDAKHVQVQRELGADKKDKESIELEHSKVHEWHIVAPKKPAMTKLINSKRDWLVLEGSASTAKSIKVNAANVPCSWGHHMLTSMCGRCSSRQIFWRSRVDDGVNSRSPFRLSRGSL